MKGRLRSAIDKRLGNKKGSAVIEYAIGLLIFVTLICFLFDVAVIGVKQYVVSQQTNEISRQLAIQGGTMASTPSGFQGQTGVNYFNTQKIFSTVKDNFDKVGIEGKDWSMQLIGYNKNGSVAQTATMDGTSSSYSFKFDNDYGRGMDVVVTYRYKWVLWGQIIGSLSDVERTEKRHVVSEFKYNYDSWDGE